MFHVQPHRVRGFAVTTGLLVLLSTTASTQQTITTIPPFQGQRSENLENVIPKGTFHIDSMVDVFGGDVTFMSLVAPPNNTTIHLWGGSCLGGDCANPLSGMFLIGATTAQAIVFNTPATRFGARFTNTSSMDDATATFYDAAGNLLGTKNVAIPVRGVGWYWNGWSFSEPVGRIEIHGNGFLEGFLWLDDLELDQALATCLPRNGTGANPTGFSCLDTPKLGTLWQATVEPLSPAGPAIATAIVTGLGGPTSGVFFPAGEALILPPYRFDISSGGTTGLHAIPIPGDPGLSGTLVSTQGLRVVQRSSGSTEIVLLNALDLMLGY